MANEINLAIGQTVITSSTPISNNILYGGKVIKFSIYALPGCTFKINNEENIITINNTGLFNFSLPENLYENASISTINITPNTQQLLAAAGAKAVIDFVYMVAEE